MAINYTRTNRPSAAARTVEPSVELRAYILARSGAALRPYVLRQGETISLTRLASVRQS